MYCDSFTQHPYFEVYTNTDWAGNKETWKSSFAYVAMIADCPVSWSSKRLTIVTQSSIKTEYIAASKATKEVVLIGCLLEELY